MLEVIRPDHEHDEYVRARNHLENRGFFYFPCTVDDSLKAHDDELAVWKNERTGKYRIVGRGLWTIMEVDGDRLYDALIDRIRRIDSHRGYRAIDELKHTEDAQEKARERETDDIAYNLAKDTRKIVSSLN